MYVLKNAWTSIVRNKGRNILIGIIILVIACAAAVSLAIDNSSQNLIDSYAAKYETETTLGMDRKSMMGNFDPQDRDSSREQMQETFSSASNLTVEEVESYADSELVKSYYYTLTTGADSNDIEAASASVPENTDGENGGGDKGGMMQGGHQPGGFEGNMMSATSGDFSLRAYSSIDSMNEFIEGTYTVSDGAVFTDFESDSCLINSELATLNELSVGDTITLVSTNDEGKTYELTIVGIFEENTESDTGEGFQMFSSSANTIITTTGVINKMQADDEELSVSVNPTFTLTSSDVVEDFETELRDKGLNEYLSVQTNLDQISEATSTISNVRGFAITFLIVVLIIGTIVLFVINMINIRERKYEIGVLRTIGMKKSTVSCQFVCELMMVSIVALFLGAGIGTVISVPVSNSLLQNEIDSAQNSNDKISQNFGFKGGENGGDAPDATGTPDGGGRGGNGGSFRGVAQVQAFDSIDAAVDLKVLLELLGIGLTISLLSSIATMVSIQKYSPLTILKERA